MANDNRRDGGEMAAAQRFVPADLVEVRPQPSAVLPQNQRVVDAQARLADQLSQAVKAA